MLDPGSPASPPALPAPSSQSLGESLFLLCIPASGLTQTVSGGELPIPSLRPGQRPHWRKKCPRESTPPPRGFDDVPGSQGEDHTVLFWEAEGRGGEVGVGGEARVTGCSFGTW